MGKYHRVIGIDLGTTYSSVSIYNKNSMRVEMLMNRMDGGCLRTPSVLSIDPVSRKAIVGRAAKNNLPNDPQNTIVEIKREMGEEFRPETIVKYNASGVFNVGEPVKVYFDGLWLMPQEISAFILMRMKQVAEEAIGEEVRDAVVTVPAYFMEKQKKATREAALLAGLYPRHIIPEPTAAAICYGVDRQDPEKRCYLVYDLGGGTFDVSIIRVEGAQIEVIATSGDSRLGGSDFDDAITAWAVEQVYRPPHSIDLRNNPRARALIKLKAEEAKILLSTYQDTVLAFPEINPQNPPRLTLTREKLKEFIEPFLRHSLSKVDDAINLAVQKGIAREDLDAILLVGGSSRIPLVKTLLLDYFRRDEDFIRTDADPSAVVAIGAGLIAHHLADNNMVNIEADEKIIVHPITEHSLGVRVPPFSFSRIIDRGANIPISKIQGGFTNAEPSPDLNLEIYQGESEDARQNTLIGTVHFGPIEPREGGYHRFEVKFSIDHNGLLDVEVHHLNTGNKKPARFEHKTGVGGVDALSILRDRLLKLYAGTLSAAQMSMPSPQVVVTAPVPPRGVAPSSPVADGEAAQMKPTARSMKLVVASVEFPAEFKRVVRRSQKMLEKAFDEKVADAYNAFITAINQGKIGDELEDLCDKLEDAYDHVKQGSSQTMTVITTSTAEHQPASLTRDAKPIHIDENVQFTVYRPRAIVPDQWYPLLAFAHLSAPKKNETLGPDPFEEVKRQAETILGENRFDFQPLVHDSPQGIPRGGEITFFPAVSGIEFNPPKRTFHWVEPVHREEFRLCAGAAMLGRTARGRLSIFLGSILLSDVGITIRVHAGSEMRKKGAETEVTQARPYRKIFASYSHKDAVIVEQFERYIHTLGDQYLRDSRSLRAGEYWGKELAQLITEADIFQLFWSWNSMRSQFVRQEWEHALSLNRQNFVRPTYWEEPLPETSDMPPAELRQLHFQKLPIKSLSTFRMPETLKDLSPNKNIDKASNIKFDGKKTIDKSDFSYAPSNSIPETKIGMEELISTRAERNTMGHKIENWSGNDLDKIGSGAGLGLRKPPELQLSTAKKAESFDYLKIVDSMKKKASQKSDASGAALTIQEIDLGDGLVDLRRNLVDEKEVLLQKARRLIKEEKFEEALVALQKLLAASRGHHEALYLTAFCHASLKREMSALEALLPLHQARLDNTLAARVKALRQCICSDMFLPVLLENLMLISSKQHPRAVKQLQRIIELDPDVGIYHFMLAGTLMLSERHTEALQAIDRGMGSCSGTDRENMTQLRSEIEKRYLQAAMAPARDLYRRGRFAGARKHLKRIDPIYHQAPLFVTFDNYLCSLGGGSGIFSRFSRFKSVRDVAPAGEFKDVDELYFFLVGEDLKKGQKRLEADLYYEAEMALVEALGHAPRFPFANYLYSGMIFQRLWKMVENGTPEEPEESLSVLERALAHARIGATDREIKAAPMLVKVIEETVVMGRKFVAERKELMEETKPINGAIEEFKAIMKLAENGVRSLSQFEQVYSQMRTLQGRIPGLKSKARSPQPREAVEMLSTAVERNCEQLERMKADVYENESVRVHFETFEGMLAERTRKGPITSRDELNQVRSQIMQLKQRVDADQSKARNENAREQLNSLSNQMQTILSQLG